MEKREYIAVVDGVIENLKASMDTIAKVPRGQEVAIIEMAKAIVNTVNFAENFARPQKQTESKDDK